MHDYKGAFFALRVQTVQDGLFRQPASRVSGLALAVFILLASCAAQDRATTVPFDTLARGTSSGITEARRDTIRDGNAFAALWQRHAAAFSPPPALPAVDFTRDMVIAVWLGQRPTGGHAIEIVRLVETPENLRVETERRTPPPGALVTQALTQPFHLIRARATHKPVTFDESGA